jgi:hypothetical protein
VFESQLAPLVIAELTPSEIERVAKQQQTVSVGWYVEAEKTELLQLTSNINNAWIMNETNIGDLHNLGLKGHGVRVGMIERATIQESSELPAGRIVVLGEHNYETDHADAVASVLAGETGVASEARLWSSTGTNGSGENCFVATKQAFEALIASPVGVTIVNLSFAIGLATTAEIDCMCGYSSYHCGVCYPYPLFASWLDHIVSVHNVTVLAAAGNTFSSNSTDVILSAVADNVISVTAFDMFTDTMFNFRYSNGNHASKPDIVSWGGATSISAPFASGVVALMQQVRPSLRTQPHVIKAILQASSHRKAENHLSNPNPQETMTNGFGGSGLTERQGAGVLCPYTAVAITMRGNFRTGTINQGARNIAFRLPQNGATGLNVSLSWLREAQPGPHGPSNTITSLPRENLGLYLQRGSTTVASSNLPVSSTEMVYFNSTRQGFSSWNTNPHFNVRVEKHSPGTAPVRFAIAWSVDTDNYGCDSVGDGFNVVYDSWNDSNKVFFMGNHSSQNSTHWLLGSNGGVRWPLSNSINITQRGGTSQGVDIRLPALRDIAHPNRAYRIEFNGEVESQTGPNDMWINAVSGHSGAGGNVRTLRQTPNRPVNNFFTDFELTYTLTYEAIFEYLAEGVGRLRLGGASQQDLWIDRIRIIEIPLDGTIYDLSMDSSIHRLHGYGSTTPGAHPLLTSTGRRAMHPTPESQTIAITARGGTSQGIDIRLADLRRRIRQNHKYEFAFYGNVTSGNGAYNMFLHAITGGGGSPLQLESENSSYPAFAITHISSYNDIVSYLEDGIRMFRLGGASGRDLMIYEIFITEICESNCC